MKSILVVAPHPDDETLGCGGTLLRHVKNGDKVHWLIVTEISKDLGFSQEQVSRRNLEISQVGHGYSFAEIFRLGFPTMCLDRISKRNLIESIAGVVRKIEPEIMYIPYRNDAHTDHASVFDAAVACAKSFRYPSVRSVYVYETLSETEFGLRVHDAGFRPNLLIDITDFIDQKIAIMRLFEGEMGDFPFPRSEVCIRAQSALRGSQAGVLAAEAFMIIKEIR